MSPKRRFLAALLGGQVDRIPVGNINNPQPLLAGTSEEVAVACRRAIEDGIHILAPECAVSLTTPLRNLQVLVQVADEEAGCGRRRSP